MENQKRIKQIEKNQRIAKKLRETRERRKTMTCKTFIVKIIDNKLSQEKKYKLHRAFLEAKWLYNYILADFENRSLTYKIKEVTIINKYGEEERREINCLLSDLKRGIINQMIYNMRGLKVMKTNGLKIGKLKFKSSYNSISLQQFGVTYKIKDKNNIFIQGIGKLRVKGLEQLDGVPEIANGKLIKKPSGYYVRITTFSNQTETKKEGIIGIKYGTKDQLLLSNGLRFNCGLTLSKRLNKLQKKYLTKVRTHKRLGILKTNQNKVKSINGIKLDEKINKELEKINYKKDNIRNKIVSYLNRYKQLVVQSNGTQAKSLRKGGIIRKAQISGIGGITTKVKSLGTHILVDNTPAIAQTCSHCGSIKKISLRDKIYDCLECGISLESDINSLYNILQLGLKSKIPMECRKFKPVEINTSALLSNLSIESVVGEAGSYNL